MSLSITISRSINFTLCSVLVENTLLEKFVYNKTFEKQDSHDFSFDFNNGLFQVFCFKNRFNFLIKSVCFNTGQKWWKEMYYEIFKSDKQIVWNYSGFGTKGSLIAKDDPAKSISGWGKLCTMSNDYLFLEGYILRWQMSKPQSLTWTIDRFSEDNDC